MDILILFIVTANLAVNLLNFYILSGQKREHDAKEQKRRQEALCEDEMRARSAEPPTDAEDAAKKIDEGFENLMTYQVNLGRGKTTGGEP